MKLSNSIDNGIKYLPAYGKLIDRDGVVGKKKPINKLKYVYAALLAIIISGLLIVVVFGSALKVFLKNYSNNNNIEYAENYFSAAAVNVVACDIKLVESIPQGLNYSAGSPTFTSTYDAWIWLLDNAKTNLDIGSFYWTMRGEDVINHSSAAQGEDIFKRLLSNGNVTNEPKIKIRIAQSAPTAKEPDIDTQMLKTYDAADVVSVDFAKHLGGGVLHTKLWVVDKSHFYLGSANMDWRSLTQVKELGVLATNCPDLASDVQKIFEAYWYLGKNPDKNIPDSWPYDYVTDINLLNPILVNFNQKYIMKTYFSSSPPPLSARGRTHDLDAILNAIDSAVSYINIAVMDYYPLIIYTPKPKYWPYIDNALRRAAVERKISVKLLISWWPHSDPSEDYFLRSLQDLSNIAKEVDLQIRRFIVPANDDQSKIPYARVNHNKYMVTDNVAYIGTSNWSGDYFTDTAGIGLVLKETTEQSKSLRSELQSVFERDWYSPYAHRFVVY